MGIPPLFWGAKFWSLFHYLEWRLDTRLAETATFMRLQGIAEFHRSFGRLLPCGDCTNHFMKELGTDFNPQTHRWPTSYFDWSVDVRQRVARRVGKPERSKEQVQPVFGPEWIANAWFVFSIMAFNYPTVPMEDGFFSDVRLFFRTLPRLVPEAFLPEVWTPLLDKKGDTWCLTKASFLDTIFELRHAHSLKYSLSPVITSIEHMQQVWLQELDAFVTEYHRRHAEETKLKAEALALAMSKQAEADAQAQAQAQEKAKAEAKEKEAVEKKPQKKKPILINAAETLQRERRIQKQKDKQAVLNKEKIPLQVPLRVNNESVVPVVNNADLQFDDEITKTLPEEFTKTLPEEFTKTLPEESYGCPGPVHMYEDEFEVGPAALPPAFSAATLGTTTNGALNTNVNSTINDPNNTKPPKKGFQFCFNGKDYAGSYWIVWVALIVIAVLLLGVGSYTYLTTPQLVVVSTSGKETKSERETTDSVNDSVEG